MFNQERNRQISNLQKVRKLQNETVSPQPRHLFSDRETSLMSSVVTRPATQVLSNPSQSRTAMSPQTTDQSSRYRPQQYAAGTSAPLKLNLNQNPVAQRKVFNGSHPPLRGTTLDNIWHERDQFINDFRSPTMVQEQASCKNTQDGALHEILKSALNASPKNLQQAHEQLRYVGEVRNKLARTKVRPTRNRPSTVGNQTIQMQAYIDKNIDMSQQDDRSTQRLDLRKRMSVLDRQKSSPISHIQNRIDAQKMTRARTISRRRRELKQAWSHSKHPQSNSRLATRQKSSLSPTQNFVSQNAQIHHETTPSHRQLPAEYNTSSQQVQSPTSDEAADIRGAHAEFLKWQEQGNNTKLKNTQFSNYVLSRPTLIAENSSNAKVKRLSKIKGNQFNQRSAQNTSLPLQLNKGVHSQVSNPGFAITPLQTQSSGGQQAFVRVRTALLSKNGQRQVSSQGIREKVLRAQSTNPRARWNEPGLNETHPELLFDEYKYSKKLVRRFDSSQSSHIEKTNHNQVHHLSRHKILTRKRHSNIVASHQGGDNESSLQDQLTDLNIEEHIRSDVAKMFVDNHIETLILNYGTSGPANFNLGSQVEKRSHRMSQPMQQDSGLASTIRADLDAYASSKLVSTLQSQEAQENSKRVDTKIKSSPIVNKESTDNKASQFREKPQLQTPEKPHETKSNKIDSDQRQSPKHAQNQTAKPEEDSKKEEEKILEEVPKPKEETQDSPVKAETTRNVKPATETNLDQRVMVFDFTSSPERSDDPADSLLPRPQSQKKRPSQIAVQYLEDNQRPKQNLQIQDSKPEEVTTQNPEPEKTSEHKKSENANPSANDIANASANASACPSVKEEEESISVSSSAILAFHQEQQQALKQSFQSHKTHDMVTLGDSVPLGSQKQAISSNPSNKSVDNDKRRTKTTSMVNKVPPLDLQKVMSANQRIDNATSSAALNEDHDQQEESGMPLDRADTTEISLTESRNNELEINSNSVSATTSLKNRQQVLIISPDEGKNCQQSFLSAKSIPLSQIVKQNQNSQQSLSLAQDDDESKKSGDRQSNQEIIKGDDSRQSKMREDSELQKVSENDSRNVAPSYHSQYSKVKDSPRAAQQDQSPLLQEAAGPDGHDHDTSIVQSHRSNFLQLTQRSAAVKSDRKSRKESANKLLQHGEDSYLRIYSDRSMPEKQKTVSSQKSLKISERQEPKAKEVEEPQVKNVEEPQQPIDMAQLLHQLLTTMNSEQIAAYQAAQNSPESQQKMIQSLIQQFNGSSEPLPQPTLKPVYQDKAIAPGGQTSSDAESIRIKNMRQSSKNITVSKQTATVEEKTGSVSDKLSETPLKIKSGYQQSLVLADHQDATKGASEFKPSIMVGSFHDTASYQKRRDSIQVSADQTHHGVAHYNIDQFGQAIRASTVAISEVIRTKPQQTLGESKEDSPESSFRSDLCSSLSLLSHKKGKSKRRSASCHRSPSSAKSSIRSKASRKRRAPSFTGSIVRFEDTKYDASDIMSDLELFADINQEKQSLHYDQINEDNLQDSLKQSSEPTLSPERPSEHSEQPESSPKIIDLFDQIELMKMERVEMLQPEESDLAEQIYSRFRDASRAKQEYSESHGAENNLKQFFQNGYCEPVGVASKPVPDHMKKAQSSNMAVANMRMYGRGLDLIEEDLRQFLVEDENNSGSNSFDSDARLENRVRKATLKTPKTRHPSLKNQIDKALTRKSGAQNNLQTKRSMFHKKLVHTEQVVPKTVFKGFIRSSTLQKDQQAYNDGDILKINQTWMSAKAMKEADAYFKQLVRKFSAREAAIATKWAPKRRNANKRLQSTLHKLGSVNNFRGSSFISFTPTDTAEEDKLQVSPAIKMAMTAQKKKQLLASLSPSSQLKDFNEKREQMVDALIQPIECQLDYFVHLQQQLAQYFLMVQPEYSTKLKRIKRVLYYEEILSQYEDLEDFGCTETFLAAQNKPKDPALQILSEKIKNYFDDTTSVDLSDCDGRSDDRFDMQSTGSHNLANGQRRGKKVSYVFLTKIASLELEIYVTRPSIYPYKQKSPKMCLMSNKGGLAAYIRNKWTDIGFNACIDRLSRSLKQQETVSLSRMGFQGLTHQGIKSESRELKGFAGIVHQQEEQRQFFDRPFVQSAPITYYVCKSGPQNYVSRRLYDGKAFLNLFKCLWRHAHQTMANIYLENQIKQMQQKQIRHSQKHSSKSHHRRSHSRR